ncbi:MAG: S1 RNA-binding domain-containing protein [Pseudohongiellaceae bacterium]
MQSNNAWEIFKKEHRRGEIISGSISKITDYGLLVDLNSNIYGIVHINDLYSCESEEKTLSSYKVGEEVDVLILSIEPERERVVLGIKQIFEEADRDSELPSSE